MLILDPLVAGAQTNDVVPQVHDMGPGYRWDDADSVSHIVSNVPLVTVPNLRSFHLATETNLTDVVSQGYISAMGLLASQRFYDTLQGFVVQAHERYAAEVVYREASHSYSWLHMIGECVERIDYTKSEFLIRTHTQRDEPVRFARADELRARCRDLVDSLSGKLFARCLTFLPGTPRYDFFSLRLTSAVLFVSERLGAECRHRSLTGFDLLPSGAEVDFA